MSDFIQRNRVVIHIFTEVTIGCLLMLYVLRSNKLTNSRIIILETRVLKLEKTIQELLQSSPERKKQLKSSKYNQPTQLYPQMPIHNSIPISTNPVPSKTRRDFEYEPSTRKIKKFNTTLSPIPEEDYEEEIEVIETENVYEDNLDDEIENELQKLHLKR